MAWGRYRLTPRGFFILLLTASAVGLWLPGEWGDALKHPVQVLVPGDDLVYGLSHRAARSTATLDDKDRAARMEREAMLHELASQVAVAEELREEVRRLQGIRASQVPLGVPLLSAKVVAWDIVAWRDSMLVERGSYRGVSWQDWVASRLFVTEGGESGVTEGQAVLARECLLGRVEQVSPYMSRVRLLSDVDSPRIQVQIGSRGDKGVELVDYPCSLRGLGRGRMVIEDVPYQYVQVEDGEERAADHRRRIQQGDLVLTAGGQLGLPMPLVVGKVAAITQVPKKRLVYTVNVEPVVSLAEIREVFIIPLAPGGPVSGS